LLGELIDFDAESLVLQQEGLTLVAQDGCILDNCLFKMIDLFEQSGDVIFCFFKVSALEFFFKGQILNLFLVGGIFLCKESALLD
jgi:hypothetical protein